jgi:hypothetical protein
MDYFDTTGRELDSPEASKACGSVAAIAMVRNISFDKPVSSCRVFPSAKQAGDQLPETVALDPHQQAVTADAEASSDIPTSKGHVRAHLHARVEVSLAFCLLLGLVWILLFHDAC